MFDRKTLKPILALALVACAAANPKPRRNLEDLANGDIPIPTSLIGSISGSGSGGFVPGCPHLDLVDYWTQVWTKHQETLQEGLPLEEVNFFAQTLLQLLTNPSFTNSFPVLGSLSGSGSLLGSLLGSSGGGYTDCYHRGDYETESGSVEWIEHQCNSFCDSWNVGVPGQKVKITFPEYDLEDGRPYDRLTICDTTRCIDNSRMPEFFPDIYSSSFDSSVDPVPTPEMELVLTAPVYIHMDSVDGFGDNFMTFSWAPYEELTPRRWYQFRPDNYLGNSGSDDGADLQIRSQSVAVAQSEECDNARLPGCFTSVFVGRAIIPNLNSDDYNDKGWSMCMWLKLTEEPYTFVQWGGSWSSTFWYLGYVSSFGGYFFPTAAHPDWEQTSQYHVSEPPSALMDQWRHVCWVVDFDAGAQYMFLDGQRAASPYRFQSKVEPSADHFKDLATPQHVELGSSFWKTMSFGDVRLYDIPLNDQQVCTVAGLGPCTPAVEEEDFVPPVEEPARR